MLKVNSVFFSHSKDFNISEISFEIKQGEVLGIIGESGCGKTTILDLVYGKFDLAEGEMLWYDEKIKGPSKQLIFGHEDFKYVTQDSELMPFISVLDNIISPLSRQHLEKNIERAEELLEVVELSEFKHQKVKHLSGGQKQRVALAKALAKTPKLLLLDEPFSHIDNFLKHSLRRKLFKYLKSINCSCIIATHDYNDILPYANEILVLHQGKVLEKASPEKIYQKPLNSYTAGLLSIHNCIEGNHIDAELSGNQVIYPHELKLVESSENTVEITDVYFNGENYRVYFNWNAQELICNSADKPTLSKNYKLVFEISKIKQRLKNR
jgi:ABC-type sulfate/molybdate transport systems ATPase subunit